MTKGINFATAELKETLIQTINKSGVPAVNVRSVLCDLLEQVASAEQHLIAQERIDYETNMKAETEVEKEGSENGKH